MSTGQRRVVIQQWQLPLLDGYSVALRAARRAVEFARYMRTARPYAWRQIAAQYLTEARLIREHLAAGLVGDVLLAALMEEQIRQQLAHTRTHIDQIVQVVSDGVGGEPAAGQDYYAAEDDELAAIIAHDMAASAGLFGPDVQVFRL